MAQSPRLQRTQRTVPLGVFSLVLASSAAWATGFAPFTERDFATVTQGGSVSVLDSGERSVLANDFDLEGDEMTAVIDRLPRHGTVVLNSDGTFTYTHNGNDEDDDRFHYRAWDGTGISRRTRVSITIEEREEPPEPEPPTITGQRDVSVAEDDSVTIRLSDLRVSDPDSDYPDDFTLSVRNGQNYTRSGSTVTPAADFNGTLNVPVQVNDGIFDSNVFQLSVTVNPENDPPFVTGEVEEQAAQEGEPFTLELAGFFDDIDSSTLTYQASGLPPSGNLSIGRRSGRLSGTPVSVDASDEPYVVTITASDGAGGSVSLDFPLIVFPIDRADLQLTAAVSPQPAGTGDEPQWEFTVENLGPADLSEGTLEVRWSSSAPLIELELPASCVASNDGTANPSMTCTLTNVPAGSSVAYMVGSSVDAAGDVTAIAQVTGNDPIPDNNLVSASVNIASAFTEGPAQVIDVAVRAFSVVDLDDDGYEDIVVVGNDVGVLWNTGQRALEDAPSSIGTYGNGTVVTPIDWDNDGLLDVVVGGGPGVESLVFRNDGSRNFIEYESITGPQAQALLSATAADLDGDGLADWVVTGSQGTAAFGSAGGGTVIIDQRPGRDVVVGDVNQDTFMDVVVTDSSDRTVRVLTNDGMGRFVLDQVLVEGSVASVTAADVTQDGIVDLLLAVDGVDLEVPISRVLVNDLSAGFSELDTIGASPTAKLLDGDVDGDSRADIVAVKQTGVHQVFEGSSSSDFALSDEQIVSTDKSSGQLIDINADGSLDLILAGAQSTSIEIYFNDGIGRFGLGDVLAPEVALNGPATISLEVGEAYQDQGATAEDNIDGDLSDQIQVDNPVDVALVGTYTVTYSVSDRAGNLGQAERTVRIEAVTGVGGGGGGQLPWLMVLTLVPLILIRRRIGS